MFVKSDNGVKGSAKAFLKLESKLPSLKKRKFYGVLIGKPDEGEYRSCVAIVDGDDPRKMGLSTWTIPGGKYAREKIKDWEQNLDKLPVVFNKMVKENKLDSSRPTVEFYRSQKELICLLPID